MSLSLGDNKADGNKNASKPSKTMDLEQIRQTMAKRSLDVKFDLQDCDYKPVENIGIGAYGVVCSAIHTKSGDRVAIKKIPRVFDALTIAKRTYREIKILKHFNHDNIICIREILKPRETVKDFKDIYVVFDLMESDLHRIIYSKQELSEEHVRYFLYQILRGLKYIHSANVIHRDLKPSNILVNEDCHLRIGDFGMARGIFYTPDEPSYFMTQYVATRWYRAPEILLSMLEYGTAVDMWSVGCIFAEMMGRKHLFPGKDYLTQVKLILGVLGTPSEKVMSNCQNDILKRIIKSFGKKNAVEWSKLFPKASKKSIDLLSKMLVLDPAERIAPERALSHRLLNNYHDPDDEPICVPPFNFDFEKVDMDKQHLRLAIMDEVLSFHQPKPSAPALSFSAFLRPVPKEEQAEETAVSVGEGKHVPAVGGDEQTAQPSSIADDRGEKVLPQQRPPPSQISKPKPVCVDTNLLGAATSADIEMLSAQSTMDVQEVPLELGDKGEETGEHSLKAGESKDSSITKTEDKKLVVGGKTISEDTKALVKQALMNATQRKQRAESQNEEGKDSKPVTAMQRQKEREEKRRKKKKRALEKIKKTKGKKCSSQDPAHLLSSQDVELLRRWASMQKPAAGSSIATIGQDSGSTSNSNSSPPHPGQGNTPAQGQAYLPGSIADNNAITNDPGNVNSNSNTIELSGQGPNKPRPILSKVASSGSLPITLGSSLRFSSVGNNSGATVLIHSGQLGPLGQASFIPVIAIPSSTRQGKMEIKRVFQQQQPQQQTKLPQAPSVLSTPSNQAASESTRHLLQNVLRERSQSLGGSQSQCSISSQTLSYNMAPVNISENSSYANLGFGIAASADNPQELNFTQIPSSSSNSTTFQSLPHSTGQFSSAVPPSLPSDHLQTHQSIDNPVSKLEGTISPMASAGTELMEFLDQLKDSSARLKLASAGSGVSLQSPPQSAFDHSSAGMPSHIPYNSSSSESAGLNINNDLDTSKQSSQDGLAILRQHDSNSNQHQQQQPRPGRLSLPFISSSAANLEPQQQDHRPNRSSVPGISYSENHANIHHEHSVTPNSFSNLTAQQQQAAPTNGPSFSLGTYADSFLTTTHNVQETQQQQSIGVNFIPSSRQPSDMLFHPPSNFSPNQNPTQQQQSQQQQPQHHQQLDLLQFQQQQQRQQELYQPQPQHHQQQQLHPNHPHHQDQMLNMFDPNFALQSSTAGTQNLTQQQQEPQRQQMFGQPHAEFEAPSQQQQQTQHSLPDPNQCFNQVNPDMAQLSTDSKFYGLPQAEQQQQHESNSVNHGPSTSGGKGTTRSPGLKVDCGKDGNTSSVVTNDILTTSSSASAAATTTTDNTSTSHKLSHQKHQADLIALLSKQMSRAEVADVFPPALALTPRGTGAGYGVGMDLDTLLTETQDGASLRAESSPLSSSLLADWLDLSSNICQADLEALEREMALQSPMHVSYGDLGM